MMTQDIERLEHLTPVPPKEQINPMARSEEDRRRRKARDLKDKAEAEKRKEQRRKTADRLMLTDPELVGEAGEEPVKQEDADENETSSVDDQLNKDTSDGHIDLKA